MYLCRKYFCPFFVVYILSALSAFRLLMSKLSGGGHLTSLHSPINYTQEATRDRQMKYKKHERVDQSYKSICQQSERKKEFQAQLGFLKSLDQVSLLCFVNCVTRAPLLDFER